MWSVTARQNIAFSSISDSVLSKTFESSVSARLILRSVGNGQRVMRTVKEPVKSRRCMVYCYDAKWQVAIISNEIEIARKDRWSRDCNSLIKNQTRSSSWICVHIASTRSSECQQCWWVDSAETSMLCWKGCSQHWCMPQSNDGRKQWSSYPKISVKKA